MSFLTITSPFLISCPISMIKVPGVTAFEIKTLFSCLSVNSTITTPFELSGIAAPVAIYEHWPLFNLFWGISPAWIVSIRSSSIKLSSSAPKVSSAITAYPSIRDFLKWGTFIVLVIFLEIILLKASSKGISSSSVTIFCIEFSIFLNSSTLIVFRNFIKESIILLV